MPRLDQVAAIREAFASPDRRSRRAVEAARDRRLRRLIAHAYTRVPYYRELFDAHGLRPEHVRTAADLVRVPITSKRDLLARDPRDLVAEGLDPATLITHHTCGSTGEPMDIRHTWLEERVLAAYRKRAMRSFGLRARDRIAQVKLVRGKPVPDDERLSKLIQRLGVYRQRNFHCLRPPEDILDDLAAWEPQVLVGTMGVLARLAHVARTHPAGARVRPRFVAQTGEVVTPDHHRLIMAGFGCELLETYSSVESNVMACQCLETGQLHTCDDATIVEILRGDEPVASGERGEVVATSLHSLAMPYIRYRQGDIATRGEDRCPCDAPFGTIRQVQGRMLDWFVLPGDRMIHPWEITAIVVGDWVLQRQMTQHRRDLIVVQVVPSFDPDPRELESICEEVKELLGPGVEFRIDFVDVIDFEASGKFRVNRSMVSSEYDDLKWTS